VAFRKFSPSLFSQDAMLRTGPSDDNDRMLNTALLFFFSSLHAKHTYHLVMTGDVGLLEKRAQSRLWKERERERWG